MEGAVVSAKKAGSTVTVSVVSDAQGRFSFPSAKLGSGSYSLKVRATGFELDGPRSAEITPRPARRGRPEAAQGPGHHAPDDERRMDRELSRTPDQKKFLTAAWAATPWSASRNRSTTRAVSFRS